SARRDERSRDTGRARRSAGGVAQPRPERPSLTVHLAAKAERPHVDPDLADERQAFGFEPLLSSIAPAVRQVALERPYRRLLLVMHDYEIELLVVVSEPDRDPPCTR